MLEKFLPQGRECSSQWQKILSAKNTRFVRSRLSRGQSSSLSDSSGEALFVALVLVFILVGFTMTLLTAAQINNNAVRATSDKIHANYAALTALNIAVDQINEIIISNNPRLNEDSAGNFEGRARSVVHPDVAPAMNASGGYSSASMRSGGSIDNSVESLVAISGATPMPTGEVLLSRPDGSFAVRASRLADGSWKIFARAKHGQFVKRIVTLLTPDESSPFRVGIFGRDSVVVQGPGNIDWINTSNPLDTVIPTVLESGGTASGALVVTKEPPVSGN